MKQKILFSFSMVMALLMGCGDEREPILFNGPHIASVSRSAIVVNENDADGVEAEITVSRTFPTDISLSFSVAEENARAGADYNFAEATVLIPAGSYKGYLRFNPIDNGNFDGNRRVTVTLTSASEGSLQIAAEREVTFNILNDDCPVKTSIWAGDIFATEFYAEDPPYGPFPVNLGPNQNGDCNILLLNNIGDFSGDKAVTMIFTPESEGATKGTVTIARQGIGTYGASGERTVEGVGTYDESTKEIEIYLVFYFGNGGIFYDTTTIFLGN